MTREAINFSWLIKLRWGAIAGQIVTILGVSRLMGVPLVTRDEAFAAMGVSCIW